MSKFNLTNTAFALVVFSALPAAPAHAYLDGGTVSMVLQALAGAVASVLLFGKVYWSKFKSLFGRSDSKSDE